MYKRVLLAYDGSAEGRTALREGALLARRCGAQVFLLAVVSTAGAVRAVGGLDAGFLPSVMDNYKALLEDGVARLRAIGFEPKAKLVSGEPAEQIGAYAKQIGADLVVVGHRKQSLVQRWWSGSVNANLLDYTYCSLLISRAQMSDAVFADELNRCIEAAKPN